MKEGKDGLKVIEVVPIVRGIGKETLSYFSTESIPTGTLVEISIRKKQAKAIVVESKDAYKSKADLKKSAFSLKKIAKRDILPGTISPQWLRAAELSAEYYGVSLGSILSALLSKFLLDEPELIRTFSRKIKNRHHFEPLIIQLETEERFAQYRSMVRDKFARKTSVMFV